MSMFSNMFGGNQAAAPRVSGHAPGFNPNPGEMPAAYQQRSDPLIDRIKSTGGHGNNFPQPSGGGGPILDPNSKLGGFLKALNPKVAMRFGDNVGINLGSPDSNPVEDAIAKYLMNQNNNRNSPRQPSIESNEDGFVKDDPFSSSSIQRLTSGPDYGSYDSTVYTGGGGPIHQRLGGESTDMSGGGLNFLDPSAFVSPQQFPIGNLPGY